jgi:glycosyltransferase involved in cell wall biosynthesis
MTNCPLSVIIPCIPRDTITLVECLKSITEQTLLPFEVIIAHSEITEKKALILLNKLNSQLNNSNNKYFKLIICNTENKHYAGENRNMGMLKTNESTTHISFFDADDIMSKHRIKILYDLFLKYDSFMIFHSHTNDMNLFTNINIDNICIDMHANDMLEVITRMEKRNKHYKSINPSMTHGHCSIKKHVITSNIKYPSIRCGEDVKFCKDVVKYYANKNNNSSIFVNVPLSYYIPAEHKHVQKK